MAEWWENAPVAGNAPVDPARPTPKEEAAGGDWWADAPKAEPYKGSVLPFSRDEKGDVSFDITAGLPGLAIDAAKGLWSGATMAGDVLTGKEQLTDEDGRIRPQAVLRGVEAVSLGVTKPLADKGAKSVAELAKHYLAQPENALAGISPNAVRYARNTFSDPQKQAGFLRELQRLGPQSTLADVSPEWMGVARGAASRPGQRDTILTPLLERDATKNQRLRGDLDRSLGPVQTPSRVEASLAANREALSPEYTHVFQGARRVDTRALADRLDELAINTRGPGQQNARRVREMLNIPGQNELDPHPGALLQTRQAIDGMLDGETNTQVIRVLEGARRQVDETLAAAVPGVKDVDAKFSEQMRQSEGLQRGSQVLDSGKTAVRPDELQAELAEAAIPQGNMTGPSGAPLRIRQGTRAEIDRVQGQNANDPVALQKLVKGEGDWNRDKLRTVFGQEPADTALDAIDREATFNRTTGRVASGSDSAMGQRFGDFLDEAATPNKVPTDTTITGAAVRGGQKLIQSIMRTNSESKAERFAEALGRLAVAQGVDRDRIVMSLQAAVAARQAKGLPTEALEGAMKALSAPAALALTERTSN